MSQNLTHNPKGAVDNTSEEYDFIIAGGKPHHLLEFSCLTDSHQVVLPAWSLPVDLPKIPTLRSWLSKLELGRKSSEFEYKSYANFW